MLNKSRSPMRSFKKVFRRMGWLTLLFSFIWLLFVCFPYIWQIKEGGKNEMFVLISSMVVACLFFVIGLSGDPRDKDN